MKRTDITALFPDATDEQIQKIMDLNGGDINRAKEGVTALQGQLAAAQERIGQLEARDPGADYNAVKAELDALKAANALRDLRAQVSKDTGVPAELLTGDTEEACKAQAEGIKAYSKAQPPAGYPAVPDGGEVHATGKDSARDKFADWMAEHYPAPAL